MKKKNGLAKKNKAKDSEVLATMTCNGKKMNIERWHIAGICIPPTCIAGSEKLNEEHKARLEQKFEAVKFALRSKSQDLQDEAIDTMLGDLVAGAYQDKLITYTRVPSGNSLEALISIQKVRQSVDTHLLNIIKAIRDIKRPPVNVVVKEAEQVNVAEQINQGEQQVNIGKHQANIGNNKQSS